MSYAQWRNSHFNSCIGVLPGLPGKVRTVYLFSLCLVSLLSSRLTASALVWFYNFLQYLTRNIGRDIYCEVRVGAV
jgi:hypothetical protein